MWELLNCTRNESAGEAAVSTCKGVEGIIVGSGRLAGAPGPFGLCVLFGM